MFSQELQRYALRAWQAAPAPLPSLEGLSHDEAVLCQLAYGTLPASDTAGVPMETILGYVRHALFLRSESPYCRELPEDLFLHFVFYPRVNSENLEDCRGFFYRQLAPRLSGLGPAEAVLEVNRWCAEQMTYQASNDRTESPLTAYRSGTGRCGEESTFTVTALRSVGIPARQIYVPYWAHCDDNHAWVEAYTQGRWHFLGACEPEPVLDRGWFSDAASRAPVACYRRFFEFTGEATAPDRCIADEGCCRLYNVIDRYAPASELTVLVRGADGKALPGVRVWVDVVNAAALRPVACLETDGEGLCRIRLGHVSVRLEARAGEGFASEALTVSSDTAVTLTLASRDGPGEIVSFDCYAPPAAPVHPTAVTAEQRAENEKVLARCAALRAERISSWYLPEYDALDADWREILRLAGGNAPQLYSLYQTAAEEERPLYMAMLRSLETKDYRDTPAALLRAHLKAALPFRQEPHFVEEILCPRIHNEMLEEWREPLAAAFSEEQKERFRRDPRSLMAYIRTHFPEGGLRFYPALSLQPTAALKLGHADEQGRRLLFVAVLRTLGVPARISPTDGGAEYFRDGAYHTVTGEVPTATVCLLPQRGQRFVYDNSFTLSRLEDGRYLPLKGPDCARPLSLSLAPGEYRLLTSNRLPNGSQLCRMTRFTLGEGAVVTLPLELREAAPEEMLSSAHLPPFRLQTADGEPISSEAFLKERTILIYLDVGKEPTEHILNEIIAATDTLRRRLARGLRLLYVLRDPRELADPTLAKALAAVPEAGIFYTGAPADAALLARKLFLEPGVWPLLVLTDSTHRGYYGTCGYQVGTIELALKLADCIPG